MQISRASVYELLLIVFSVASSSDESSSDSDSDSSAELVSRKVNSNTKQAAPGDLSDDDDEDATGPSASSTVVKTKNEIIDTTASMPDITEVGANEVLEKVGEVMSIVESVVIVKGDPSAIANHASERALDSESLLVFEDRKILGYVCFQLVRYHSFLTISRSMKHLAPRLSLSTKSNFPRHLQLAVISSRYREQYSMCLVIASLYSRVN